MIKSNILDVCNECKEVYRDGHEFEKYKLDDDGIHGCDLCDCCGSDEIRTLRRYDGDFFNCNQCEELIIPKIKLDSYAFVDGKYICLDCWLASDEK